MGRDIAWRRTTRTETTTPLWSWYAPNGSAWSMEQAFSDNRSVIGLYTAGLADGTLHLGTVRDVP